jgi:multiple sugar transport system permease protein
MTTSSIALPRSGADTAARPARTLRGRPWTPYLFLAPFFLLFAVFVVLPVGLGIWASLHRWSLGLPRQPFVGLENYTDLFTGSSVLSVEFWKGMQATAIFTVASAPLLVVLPLGLALLLNRAFPGRTFFRAVFFAPYVLGVAVIGLLWNYLFDAQLGPVNQILGALGLPADVAWTTSLPAGWVALVVATLWWTLGFNTVIYLAALADVPAELYDAAKVDGAGAWQRLWAVTVPGISRVLQFVVMITIIASANMFGQSELITQEQPGTATRTAIGFIAHTGIAGFDIGSSSAMSMILACSLMAVSALVFLLFRKVGDTE